jgi:hypothetical protein
VFGQITADGSGREVLSGEEGIAAVLLDRKVFFRHQVIRWNTAFQKNPINRWEESVRPFKD